MVLPVFGVSTDPLVCRAAPKPLFGFAAVCSTLPSAGSIFQSEYDRLNREVYSNALPPFPGVTLLDRKDIFSMTNTRGSGPSRRLEPFWLSSHVKGELLIEAARHETAHAAALLFDEDEGHGPAWQAHAARCGASVVESLDPGHPLRRDWPNP